MSVGDVPEAAMPVYIPCRRAFTATSKVVKQHVLKVLFCLAIIFAVAWLIKWQPPRGLGLPRGH